MTLTNLRLKIGTQEQFAKLIGVDNTTVSTWESGKRTPKTKDLPRIAEVLGVSVLDLLEALAASRQVDKCNRRTRYESHI